MPVAAEEQELLNRGIDQHEINSNDLDERQGEVARLMVNRGLLNRHDQEDGREVYTVNSCLDLWRL